MPEVIDYPLLAAPVAFPFMNYEYPHKMSYRMRELRIYYAARYNERISIAGLIRLLLSLCYLLLRIALNLDR